jgi:Uncharacterised nucleotidyltransferase
MAAALHCRLVDRLIVEVSGAFRDAEIDHVLLKGPAIATWLYDAHELRFYGDADFLVARRDWDRAVAVLEAEGLHDALATLAHPRMESFHSHPFSARGRGDVDLHATLEGLHADFPVVWRELTARREVLRLPDGDVEMLAAPARLLHVALHAAQHRDGKAIADLSRALERAPAEEWAGAARLAARAGGLAAFANGLKTIDAGAALAGRLGLGDAESVQTLLRSGQVPLSEGLYQLSQARGARAKLAILRGELAPSPAFMRWWSPLARRPRGGLALAYLWRPVYLLLHLPSAAAAFAKARRKASDGPRSTVEDRVEGSEPML